MGEIRSAAEYADARRAVGLRRVDYGVGGVELVPADELDEAQEGYRGDGEWRESWLVIGRETAMGDPIFLDTSEAGGPVFTAMHGEGSWDPQRIADSFDGLVTALEALAKIAEGRDGPVPLEGNPLPDDEREAFLATVRDANPRAEIDFWEVLLEVDG